MVREKQGGNGVREFRLEGLGLLLVAGVLIVLLGSAFYVGRWYERQVSPVTVGGPVGAAESDPLANVEPPADVDSAADYFDEVQGTEQEAEPQREIPRETPRPAQPTVAEEEPAAPPPAEEQPPAAPAEAASDGSFYVQVFAGRDRASAETLVGELNGKGHPVRLFSEREGRGALYKVRVGGYATRDEADRMAERLRLDGYSGAWVTSVE
jgi:DedD protein